jgi:thymidylate synthase ThyX
MGKSDDLQQLANLMSKALRHRIGSIVNKDELYAAKYAKDADVIMREAEKVMMRQHWNAVDKARIKALLYVKLKKELTDKAFLDDKKFDVMNEEMEKALREFELL